MYQLTPSGSSVINLDTGAIIPLPPNESEGYAYQAWLDSGNTPLPSPTPTASQLKVSAEAAIQHLLDSTANTHGYDNILSLCSYSVSTNLTWQKEGQYGCNYRDACWTKAQQIQTDATAGNWPTTGAGQTPTVNDVLAATPAVVWPV